MGRKIGPKPLELPMRDLVFAKREQMLCPMRYEPRCPSPTCTGRDRNKLSYVRGKPNWLPLEDWMKKRDDEILYRCIHCGLVWFQERSKRPGLDARPIGYYDDFQHPWEFVSLKDRYKIREQNTSRYWYGVRSQTKAVRPPKLGGVD